MLLEMNVEVCVRSSGSATRCDISSRELDAYPRKCGDDGQDYVRDIESDICLFLWTLLLEYVLTDDLFLLVARGEKDI